MQKSVSAGAGAIGKNWGAVRKCVRNNYQSVGVRAPHSKIYSNPTSAHISQIKFVLLLFHQNSAIKSSVGICAFLVKWKPEKTIWMVHIFCSHVFRVWAQKFIAERLK